MNGMTLATFLEQMPLLAILRGIEPHEIEPVGELLLEQGIVGMEVPLNRPDAMESLKALVQMARGRALVGAGTVRTLAEVQAVAAVGGRVVVMPHTDPVLIREAVSWGMEVIPGCFTPTEAFQALEAGARTLKIFPAEALPPAAVGALLAVLPPGTSLLPVGSIRPESIAPYWMAGARGFGLGTHLYKPGRPLPDVAFRAQRYVNVLRAFRGPLAPTL